MKLTNKHSHSEGSKKTRDIEWIGGMFTLPAYVADEGEPYLVEMLCWKDADGALVGSTEGRRSEVLSMASKSLSRAIERPAIGRATRPTRIRVDSAELVEVLSAGHPELEVVCAPTPEMDDVFEFLCAQIKQESEIKESYLSPEISPEKMGSFFKSAAALFRAKPWNYVPDDRSLLSVTIEQFGVKNAAISVIGQMEESFGFIVYSSIDDFEAYLNATDAIMQGERVEVPPHFALNFEPGAELAPELRKEISEHRWKVAGAHAYPWLIAVEGELVARALTVQEVTIVEAIALAMTQLLTEKEAVSKAWYGGDPLFRTFSVTTHAGEVEVVLSAPYKRLPIEFDPSQKILSDLAVLSENKEEIDEDARVTLEDTLIRRFIASPEAKGLENIDACYLVMDLSANYLGHTIATLRSLDLRMLIFEIIPRKVSIKASEAQSVIKQVRAFYMFLKREYKLKQADACLQALDRHAVKKLETELSDSRNFGMAKSFLMGGADAGFDIQSIEGIEAWIQSMEGKPIPSSISLPSFSQASSKKKNVKEKKSKRKAAHKAHKKSK